MLRLGFPTFVAETAISCMMITGNFVFMHYLHEDGVAAFSVACYLFPLIFMFGNATAQSSLPIVSYNYGLGNEKRVHETFRLSVSTAIIFGVLTTFAGCLLAPQIVNLFIDSSSPSNAIGRNGVPLFLLTCLPFTLNVVHIGYLQSLEQYKPATVFMLLRGYILIIPSFILLPMAIGVDGLWLAEPVSEIVTFVILLFYMTVCTYRKKAKTVTD